MTRPRHRSPVIDLKHYAHKCTITFFHHSGSNQIIYRYPYTLNLTPISLWTILVQSDRMYTVHGVQWHLGNDHGNIQNMQCLRTSLNNVKYVDILPIQYVLYISPQTVFNVLSDSNGLFTNLCVLWLESEPVPVGNESASDGNSDGLWMDVRSCCIWPDSCRRPRGWWGSIYIRGLAVRHFPFQIHHEFVIKIHRSTTDVRGMVMALSIEIISILFTIFSVVNAGTLYTESWPWLLDRHSNGFCPIHPKSRLFAHSRNIGRSTDNHSCFCVESRSRNILTKMSFESNAHWEICILCPWWSESIFLRVILWNVSTVMTTRSLWSHFCSNLITRKMWILLLFHFSFSVFLNPALTPLEWISNHGVGLDNCQGDCDNDSNCNGDLICWQRGNTDSNPIPGCSGDLLAIDTANNDPGTDYCYDPTAGIWCLLLCPRFSSGEYYGMSSSWLLDRPIHPNHDWPYILGIWGKHWKSLKLCIKTRSRNIPTKMCFESDRILFSLIL